MGFTRNYRNMLWKLTTGISGTAKILNDGATLGSIEDMESITTYAGEHKYTYTVVTGNYSRPISSLLTLFFDTAVISSIGSRSNGIAFGSGSTTPNVMDYTLAAPITTISALNTATKIYTRLDNNTIRITMTYLVSSSSTATVREWGLFGEYYWYNNSSSYSSFLLYRDVLSEPITLEAGVPTTITIQFDVPSPIPTT